jgi:hypothetical protein
MSTGGHAGSTGRSRLLGAAHTRAAHHRFHHPDAHRGAHALRGRVRGCMTDTGKTVLLVEDNEDNRIVYSTSCGTSATT